MGCGVLSDCQHHRRAGLRAPRRLVRPPADDARRACPLHRRIGALRAGSQHRIPDGDARAARIRRRRAHDFVASARGRDHSAARAGPLSRLSRRRYGQLQHLWAGCRRLSHASLRLAVDLPRQCAAWPCRRPPGVAARDPAGRSTADHLRCAGTGAVHDVRQPGHFGVGRSPAYGCTHAADDPRSAGVWRGGAVGADLAGKAQRLAAHSAHSVQTSRRSGVPTAWPPATAPRWCR